jgi:hypothetical protein
MCGRQVGGASRQIRKLINPEHGGEDFLRDFQLAESILSRKSSKEFFR